MSDDPVARMQAQAAQDQAQKDQARARQHAESAEKANAERPGDKTAPAYDHSNLKDLYQVKLDSRAGETRQAAQDAKQGDKPPGNKAQEHGLTRDRPPATEAHPESSDRTARPGDRSGPDHSNLGELPKLGFGLQWPKDQVTTSPGKLPKLGLGLEWPEGQVTTSRASDVERIQNWDRKMERIAGTRPDRKAPDHSGGPFAEQTPIQQLNDALKDISTHAQDNRDKAADFLDICRRVDQLYVRQDHGAQGSTYVIRGAELHEAGFSPQDIAALDKAFRANGFAPEGQQRADYAIEPADPSQSWLHRGLTEEEADHQVAANATGKEARKWNQVAEIVWGLATAAAGIAEARGSRPGPGPGPEPERAPTYEPRTGAYKPAAPEYGGLLPYKAGEIGNMEGKQNELYVARSIAGTLARHRLRPDEDLSVRFAGIDGKGGVAQVDVIGPNGELIAVGGPAKFYVEGEYNADQASRTIRSLWLLRGAADSQGVKAQAYFTEDTPARALAEARKVLGDENVKTFSRPKYFFP